jgi:hypothetical protein
VVNASDGSQVTSFTINTTVAVDNALLASRDSSQSSGIFKIRGTAIRLPGAFAGKTNTVTVYDLTGRLVQRSTIIGTMLALDNNSKSANSTYIVHVAAITARAASRQ